MWVDRPDYRTLLREALCYAIFATRCLIIVARCCQQRAKLSPSNFHCFSYFFFYSRSIYQRAHTTNDSWRWYVLVVVLHGKSNPHVTLLIWLTLVRYSRQTPLTPHPSLLLPSLAAVSVPFSFSLPCMPASKNSCSVHLVIDSTRSTAKLKSRVLSQTQQVEDRQRRQERYNANIAGKFYYLCYVLYWECWL